MKVAFLGLGVMGYPMAGHLARQGHEVCVYNRTTAKAEQWAQDYQGTHALTPAAAVAEADIVFACVGNDDDLRAVCIGESGAFDAMKDKSVFVDHTTTSAVVARELYDIAHSKGLNFMDAPVSGGQAGAENGILTVMVGGDESAFNLCAPVMESYAQAVTHMGEIGAGQLTKMVNQICFVATLQGLSEGLTFAENAGLDAKKLLNVISKGAAGSWQMDNRGATMVDGKFDFGFAVDWVRKDLGIAMDEARRNGSPLPVTGLIDQFYREVQRLGGGRWDTSSLIEALRK